MLGVFVATAGWGVPREMKARVAAHGSGLQKYASVLSATEINSTFWRRHRPSTFERWRDSVPEPFRFAVKMPRAITHEAALVSAGPELTQFFTDIHGLGAKLGPVLVQLPASDHFQVRRVAAFFRALRARHSGPVACEPRHASWYSDVASEVFMRHDIARVIADPPRPADARAPGGSPSLRYIRWHGSPRVYWSAYGEERLAALAERVNEEAKEAAVWCVFDNTASGAALADATRLRELLRAPAHNDEALPTAPRAL